MRQTTALRNEFARRMGHVPTEIPNVGVVLAALPTHLPVNDGDPATWVVLCRRDDVADRAYSTNIVGRLGDEQTAWNGHYDMHYDEALADLYERAGIRAEVTP